MAVLMTAHIPGATKEMIDGLRPLLAEVHSSKAALMRPGALDSLLDRLHRHEQGDAQPYQQPKLVIARVEPILQVIERTHWLPSVGTGSGEQVLKGGSQPGNSLPNPRFGQG